VQKQQRSGTDIEQKWYKVDIRPRRKDADVTKRFFGPKWSCLNGWLSTLMLALKVTHRREKGC